MTQNRDHDTGWLVVAFVVGGILAVLWLAVRFAWRHPFLTLALVGSVTAYAMAGPWGLAGGWVLVVGLLVGWRHVGAGSFDRAVSWRARGSLRGWWCYGRHWTPAMSMCDLTDYLVSTEQVPRLRRVRSNPYMDRCEVRLLKGQRPDDFARKADALAHTFGTIACRTRTARPGLVHLDFTRRDALAATVPALAVPAAPDLRALPVGRREDGEAWTLPLLGRHVLIAGETGAGKGSVLQSLVRPCGPVIHTGLLRLHGIDPKGGMELAAAGAQAMYERLATADHDKQAALLADLVARMRDRAHRLKGVTRLHTPTVDDPLEVLVIDELAALTAYKPRTRAARELFGEIEMNTNLLLSQGRAVGFSVIAALQDPRKEVLPSRDLFPVRIALRLTEQEATNMVLGPGARDLGADCSRIPMAMPGTAWVWCDGDPEPTRVRAGYPTDNDIRTWVNTYRPRRPGAIDTDAIDLDGAA
jgi:DNA segregation ATPase FtsK/SpoIIIE, S-DNA-T family